MEKEITSLSVIDPLTGLYNSNKINEIVEEYQYEISRKVSILAIAYIRINNFKQIIEEYGYDESEDVISLFAKIIKTRSRFIDRIGILDNNDFIILSKGSTAEGQNVLIRDLKKYAETHLQLICLRLKDRGCGALNNWPCLNRFSVLPFHHREWPRLRSRDMPKMPAQRCFAD